MSTEQSQPPSGDPESPSTGTGYAVLNLLSDGMIASCNPAALRMFGLQREALVGRRLSSLLLEPDSGPRDPEHEAGTLQASAALRADGSMFPVDVHISAIDPAAGGTLVIIRDITFEKQSRELMRKMTLAVEQTADSVMITDRDGFIDYVNRAFELVTGYTRSEALGRTGNIVKSGWHDAGFYGELWKTIRSGSSFRAVFRNRRKNGDLYYEEKTITPIRDDSGTISHFVSTAKEVTERIRAEEHLNRLANYDGLTGLPNRALFMDRLQGAIAAAARNNSLVALFFMDLNRFKSVNDTLGHAAGDALLVEISSRLGRCLRITDTVARLGGDEFVFIINNLHNTTDAEPVLHKIFDALGAPVVAGDHKIPVSASIGISFYPRDGQTTDALIKRADTAMYRAKASGTNCFRFYRSAEGNADVENPYANPDSRTGAGCQQNHQQRHQTATQPIQAGHRHPSLAD